MPKATIQDLATLVGGSVVGDSTILVDNALPLRDAVDGCITLADSVQQAVLANQSKAQAIVVSQAFADCTKTQLIVDDIHASFIQLIEYFRKSPASSADKARASISASAVIDPSSSVGQGTSIGPRVVVEAGCTIGERCILHPGVTVMANCTIGDDCEIYPGCVFYSDTKIGNRVLIHANAILGAYGFGYKQKAGKHIRTAQLGWVEIHDDVEIGAGTTIDRGTYGATKIGQGTKIDNQVQIGHNCHIGKHNLLCAQVGIAGSCTTGDYVVMGGQVGLADHLKISDGAMIGAQAGVMSDVDPGDVIIGSPAGPRKQRFIEFAALAKLPEMIKTLRSVLHRIDRLESTSDVEFQHRDAA